MSFRFGGDEFLAIALDEPLDQVQEKCDQLLLNLKKQGYYISLGIKKEKADHVNISDLLYQVDKAMRKSKEEFESGERPPGPVKLPFCISQL